MDARIRQVGLVARHQARALFPVAPIVFSLTLLALIVAGAQQTVPVAILMRDPAQTAHYPYFVGLFSYVGVLIWAAGATVCFFSAAVVRQRLMAGYLVGGGLITTMLGLDDLFILHEEAFASINISEKAVLITYGVLMVGYFLGFYRAVLRTDFALLGLALGFFGVSVVLDQGAFNQGLNFLVDDGCKLLGIVGWTTYYARTGLQHVRSEQRG